MRDAGREQEHVEGLQSFLGAAIKRHVVASPLNRLKAIDDSPIFEEPLVGFADGDDPLFGLFKTVVGEFHLTPREALAQHVRGTTGVEWPDLSKVGVVSWILPVAKETKLSNRRMAKGPSPRWNNTRFHGEDLNDGLRRYVVSLFEERGFVAVAPASDPCFKIHRLPNGQASNWSERHVAHVAGHGTFSLSEGLITVNGVAHRCGSVVANAPFAPSPRDYSHHLEYCPYPKDGSCGACIARCPAGALGPAGHNKEKCHEWMFVTLLDWLKRPGYVGDYLGCGLCQTKVPCESRIPSRTGQSPRGSGVSSVHRILWRGSDSSSQGARGGFDGFGHANAAWNRRCRDLSPSAGDTTRPPGDHSVWFCGI